MLLLLMHTKHVFRHLSFRLIDFLRSRVHFCVHQKLRDEVKWHTGCCCWLDALSLSLTLSVCVFILRAAYYRCCSCGTTKCLDAFILLMGIAYRHDFKIVADASRNVARQFKRSLVALTQCSTYSNHEANMVAHMPA